MAEAMELDLTLKKIVDETIKNPIAPPNIDKNNHKDNFKPISSPHESIKWQCPITKTPLIRNKDGFYSEDSGIAYPILKDIPLLSQEHAVIASLFD